MFLGLAVVGSLFLLLFIIVSLFAPAFPYRLLERMDVRSDQFLHFLSTSTVARVHEGTSFELFRNGPQFYPAMIETIGRAEHSVNMECYVFRRGATADRIVAALAERARAGVQVRVLLDYIGSFRLRGEPVRTLRRAGCQLGFYQPITWHSLSRINSRTHREILVVDGRTAFVGGAGVADTWGVPTDGKPTWRDTMVRVHGTVVASIQAAFAENWLEYSGEILSGPGQFPPLAPAGSIRTLFAKSSDDDRATISRVLFQSLIESATESLLICTPYFLPDRQLRRAFIAAAKRRVRITIVVPGPETDQRWVRIVSRRHFGELLKGGLRIFEYQPSMIHQKLMIVDGYGVVLGTTNFDNRSFEHNEEDDLVLLDAGAASQFEALYRRDLEDSQEITLEGWQRRPVWERALGGGGWILERQQ